MKNFYLFRKMLFSFMLLIPIGLFAQGGWTQKADYPLSGRYYGNGFSIAGKGYFIFGAASGAPSTNKLAEYDPATNTWSLKADFPGGTRPQSHIFVLNNCAYTISGVYWSGAPLDYTGYSDVWKYDPATDTWTQMNNFPGTARHAAFSFEFREKGYFGLGFTADNNFLFDFWEYDPVTDTWTQKNNYPGPGRKSGFQLTIGDYGYLGMGISSTSGQLSDVWQYYPPTDTWTQKNNYPGTGMGWPAFFVIDNHGYVATGRKVNVGVTVAEVFRYDPGTDTWTGMTNFAGTARYAACGFTIDGKGYTGIGYSNTYENDFWEFTPPTVGIDASSDAKGDVIVSPNPAIGDIQICINNPENKEISVAAFDAAGKMIYNTATGNTSQIVTAERSLFSSGLHYIVVQLGEERFVRKLVIE